MDQQHQNYESFNDFSFVNAFAAGTDGSYAINQQQQQQPVGNLNSKNLSELGLPTLMNQEFDSRPIGNSSLYDLSNPQYNTQLAYHHHHNQQPQIPSVSSVDVISTAEQQQMEKSLKDISTVQSNENNISQKDSIHHFMDQKPTTVAFDPSQNSMMKALGIVRKDVLGASSNKKRKRIVVLNDDSDDDAGNLKSEVLDKSHENDTVSDEKNDASESDIQTDNEEGDENLTDIGALKAKFLLKNAVMIQGPDKRKKKSRLLDSDDENQLQTTSVDDIGLVNEEENEEDSFENDIIITEPVIPIETVAECQAEDVVTKSNTNPNVEPVSDNAALLVKETAVVENPDSTDVQKDVPLKTAEECSTMQSADENEIDPSMTVEAILENIKPMADDDEFFKFDKSSDENEKSIPNDEYFGSPDKQQQQQHQQGTYKGKKRGPKPGSKRIPKDLMASSAQQRKKRGDRYEEDFVDDSESGESDSNFSDSSASTSDSSDVQEVKSEKRPRGRPPLLKKSTAPVLIQAKNFTVTKVPIRKNIIKRDRFYDRSRDIPNDVYFGDVNVPLHVLHTRWGSDADSDDDWKCLTQSYRTNPSAIPGTSKPLKHLRPQFTYIHDHTEEPKLSSLKEFIHLCGIKVNYQRLFDGIKSSDHKCALLRRILAQKGMQGEPTVAKCKIIRRELQAKRESAELDKSVIITDEGAGRTRRSRRNASKNTSYAEDSDTTPIVQPATLQTLSKIRQVIDSDSD